MKLFCVAVDCHFKYAGVGTYFYGIFASSKQAAKNRALKLAQAEFNAAKYTAFAELLTRAKIQVLLDADISLYHNRRGTTDADYHFGNLIHWTVLRWLEIDIARQCGVELNGFHYFN